MTGAQVNAKRTIHLEVTNARVRTEITTMATPLTVEQGQLLPSLIAGRSLMPGDLQRHTAT